jgi:ABC-2 type transport system ATP-binding protein
VFAFLGPNGAGKTTTIRLLLALQRPTAGRASVLGRDCQADHVEIARRVGYLPGDLALHPRMTGRQHLDWIRRVRGLPDSGEADRLARRFEATMDRPCRELSTGNRQKIGLVMALMHRPELLILDEPTSGLDPLIQNEFERLMREVVGEGRTVFLSSHQLDEVQRLADEVAIIRSGSLIATDTVEGLRDAAPRRVEVRFREPVAPALFDAMDGVAIGAHDGARVELRVAGGAIAPLLRVIADHDPVDVTIRHADLEELFLELYRGSRER